ncbi:MAG: hypothetical protein PHF97_10845 [Bacteroidales bacterium]|nr:hypothetical protein [Bacteroidales bacterium]
MEFKSKQAIDTLLEVIRTADGTFLDPAKNLDIQGKVDGYQHLLQLTKSALELYLFNDPLRPVFMPMTSRYHKLLGDNVDSAYYFTQIRSDQAYRIHGKRYDSCYLSFTVYGGKPDGEMAERICNNINHTQIEFDADGSFEILFTPEPAGKNQFKLDPDAVNLITREYFFDRFNSRESDLHIENLKPVEPPLPLDDDELARRIRIMTTFIQHTTWTSPMAAPFPVNGFFPPFPFMPNQKGWGTPDNIYCLGRFKLAPNQYLKISFSSPECCYWGIQTWNFLMQSMDYMNYKVCVNKGNAKPNPDGSYTIYLGHKPVDAHNSMLTAGYNEGIIFCRWLLAKEMPKPPVMELMEF